MCFITQVTSENILWKPWSTLKQITIAWSDQIMHKSVPQPLKAILSKFWLLLNLFLGKTHWFLEKPSKPQVVYYFVNLKKHHNTDFRYVKTYYYYIVWQVYA